MRRLAEVLRTQARFVKRLHGDGHGAILPDSLAKESADFADHAIITMSYTFVLFHTHKHWFGISTLGLGFMAVNVKGCVLLLLRLQVHGLHRP